MFRYLLLIIETNVPREVKHFHDRSAALKHLAEVCGFEQENIERLWNDLKQFAYASDGKGKHCYIHGVEVV
jgi:hypothetical protein